MSSFDKHYEVISKKYHDMYFYKENSPFEFWQLSLIRNIFDPNLSKEYGKVLDIG